MNCEEAEGLLAQLVYDELDDETRKRLRAHVDECAACRELAGDMRVAAKLLKEGVELETPVLSNKRKAKLLKAARRERWGFLADLRGFGRATRRLLGGRGFGAAAAAVLVFALAAGLLLPSLKGARERCRRPGGFRRAIECTETIVPMDVAGPVEESESGWVGGAPTSGIRAGAPTARPPADPRKESTVAFYKRDEARKSAADSAGSGSAWALEGDDDSSVGMEWRNGGTVTKSLPKDCKPKPDSVPRVATIAPTAGPGSGGTQLTFTGSDSSYDKFFDDNKNAPAKAENLKSEATVRVYDTRDFAGKEADFPGPDLQLKVPSPSEKPSSAVANHGGTVVDISKSVSGVLPPGATVDERAGKLIVMADPATHARVADHLEAKRTERAKASGKPADEVESRLGDGRIVDYEVSGQAFDPIYSTTVTVETPQASRMTYTTPVAEPEPDMPASVWEDRVAAEPAKAPAPTRPRVVGKGYEPSFVTVTEGGGTASGFREAGNQPRVIHEEYSLVDQRKLAGRRRATPEEEAGNAEALFAKDRAALVARMERRRTVSKKGGAVASDDYGNTATNDAVRAPGGQTLTSQVATQRAFNERGLGFTTGVRNGPEFELRLPPTQQRTQVHVEGKFLDVDTDDLEDAGVEFTQVDAPVVIHEEMQVADHFETENNMDSNTARGQEDAISDIPLGGTGVVGNLGVGGGAAGTYGQRYASRRDLAKAKKALEKSRRVSRDADLKELEDGVRAMRERGDGSDSLKFGCLNKASEIERALEIKKEELARRNSGEVNGQTLGADVDAAYGYFAKGDKEAQRADDDGKKSNEGRGRVSRGADRRELEAAVQAFRQRGEHVDNADIRQDSGHVQRALKLHDQLAAAESGEATADEARKKLDELGLSQLSRESRVQGQQALADLGTSVLSGTRFLAEADKARRAGDAARAAMLYAEAAKRSQRAAEIAKWMPNQVALSRAEAEAKRNLARAREGLERSGQDARLTPRELAARKLLGLKTEAEEDEKANGPAQAEDPVVVRLSAEEAEAIESEAVIEVEESPGPEVKDIEIQIEPDEPDESAEVATPVEDLPPPPVNPFVLAARDRFSTFAMDVDTAAYTIARRHVFSGSLPPRRSVRMEEFVNAFDYNYPTQARNVFNIHVDGTPAPFGRGLHLVKIGIQAKVLGREGRKPAHLVFVVDASGSMDRADRLPLAKRSLGMLVGALGPRDRVSLVVFGVEERIVMEAVPATRRAEILRAVDAIQAGGYTNMFEGLARGYEVAARQFRSGEINRVVLCSDGVANVGVAEPERMLELTKRFRKRGIEIEDADGVLEGTEPGARFVKCMVDTFRGQGVTLTTAGFGSGSYDDDMLERLANSGDGAYVFIDSEGEARRVFVDEMAATLQTVAKDAKIQVEFAPSRVRRYRLIGYENRDVADKDFRNDKIDAGEVGSGQAVTALYEIELERPSDRTADIGTVYVRYRNTDTGRVEEISTRMCSNVLAAKQVTERPRLFLAACAAETAEVLRGSEHAKGGSLDAVERVMVGVANALPLDAKAAELLKLVYQAKALRGER